MNMAFYCIFASKPFLAVLDACYSTVFAERTIQRLDQTGDLDRVNATFVTSGRGPCFNSAVVVSTQTPALLPSWDGVSYKINNSMFSRSLLLDLTYKLAGYHHVAIADLPGQMNVASAEMKNGFEAAVQFSGLAKEHALLCDFFPWGPVAAGAKSRANPNVYFRALIPDTEMGLLFDDIGRFWNGLGSEAWYEFLFVDIVYDGNMMRVTATGQLSDSDRQQAAILQQLKTFRRSPAAERPRMKRKPVHIPFRHIAKHVYARLRAGFEEGRWLRDTTSSPLPRSKLPERSDEMHKFVVKLNGKFPDSFSEDVWRICEFTVKLDKGEIENLIVEARNEAARELNIDLTPNE
jgi:hypothetical protein